MKSSAILRTLLVTLALLAKTSTAMATITVTGLTNQSRYNDSVTFTIAAEAGFTTTANVDGTSVAIGSPVTISSVRYHELAVQKQPTAGGAVETALLKFIVRNSARITTEDGIPSFTPPPLVDDAPSALTAGTLTVVAPASFPAGLPIPVATYLRNSAGQPLWLNGNVQSANFPGQPLRLIRGWGSAFLPAATTVGTLHYDATLAGHTTDKSISIEANPTWTDKTGTIATQDWGSNARIHLSGVLTISPGSVLTIGAGTVVRLDAAAEIVANGAAINLNGTLTNPVIFLPSNASQPWGGIRLTSTSGSRLTATGTIFTGSGADPLWFNTHAGYGTHRREQACVLVDTAANASLTNCFITAHAGQAFNLKNGTLSLTDCLIQRVTTGGQMNDGNFTVLRCGLIEIPDSTTNFVDGDNDGFYLEPNAGTYNLTRLVVAQTKDDGLDSLAGNIIVRDCWLENTFHEGFSPAAAGHNSQNHNTVYFHCGQGLEQGFDACNTSADNCLAVGCMNGFRSGDNYGPPTFSTYTGLMTVTNSISIYNAFHDVWGYEWASWTYRTNRMSVTGNLFTEATPLHSGNAVWNPASDATRLTAFMPAGGGPVGIAITGTARQLPITEYPGQFDLRLSTFSANPVSATYQLIGKTDPAAATESVLATGTVSFSPGETLKRITLPITPSAAISFLQLSLTQPVNAEVTGTELSFYATPPSPADAIIIPKAASGWLYQALRAEPSGNWRGLPYPETNWNINKTAPIGFGVVGPTTAPITLGTTLTATEQGSSTNRTLAVYFRRHFNLTNAFEIKALTLKLMRDDGAVVYVNGQQVGRSNIDSGATTGGFIGYSTLAATAVDAADEITYYPVEVDPAIVSALQEGDNVIAVEVHQFNATSSDLSFDLELTASYHPPTDGVTGLGRTTAGRHYLYWLDPRWTLQTSDTLSNWQPLPNTPNPLPLTTDQSRKFYRWQR